MSRHRAVLADALGLTFLLLVLLDYLRPSLLLLPTVTAGGDTPCHYPTFAFFYEHLLPSLRLHGWYAGAYLGHPLLLYYFPLPFLVMSALAPLVGMPAAFKLGSVLGVFLLPFLSYAAFRLMGFRFPGPLLGAASALFFLFLEANPIWGGSMASTLTGEFSYTYGIGLGVLFLGVVYDAYARGRRAWVPGAVLALTALAHGYAVLWAGFSAVYFLYSARRPARSLVWLASVALIAFALAAFWLLPLLAGWGWTTRYDDPWITVTPASLLPPFLWPLVLCAFVGLAATFLLARRRGGPDHRLLFLLHAALVGAALAAAGPALGIIDVRFVPFAQLSLCLAGGASLALALEGLAAPDLAALALVVLCALYGDGQSQVLRAWIDWNYSGLEAKELWPAWHKLTTALAGSVADARVAVEYSAEHEKAGSIRMYETLPFFSGRSTLEGVYNQASLATHAVYYVASELDATSPNPFRSREYSSFDTDNALRHLRLFNTREIVAVSPKLTAALEARPDLEVGAKIPPYSIFRLRDPGPGYVEPLRFAPVRSSPREWREKAYRWFTRKPLSPVLLAFTDDARVGVAEPDEWLAPSEIPLEPGVMVRATMQAEAIEIHTSRLGHPLLVKVAYHPRWKAEGADGPYLVAPALMMIVPRQSTVRLSYSRTRSDAAGLGLTLGTVALGAFRLLRKRKAAPALAATLSPRTDACELPRAPRRWGGAIAASLLVLLAAGRFAAGARSHAGEFAELFQRASSAFAAGRFADAAEYARHAIPRAPKPDAAAPLRCLRGDSLLAAGRPNEAAEEFDAIAREKPETSLLPRALFGSATAHQAAGDHAAATASEDRLLTEYPATPWAARLRAGKK
jgi:TolA-binding protein